MNYSNKYPNTRIGNAGAQVVNIFSNTVRSLVIEITVRTGVTQYYLGNIRRLQDTLLQQLIFPYDSVLTRSTGNTVLVSETTIKQAYLTLLNKEGDAIIDHLPVLRWFWDDTTNSISIGFADLNVDWEKSYISFPSSTQPDADNGEILQIVVDYCCQKDAN